MQGSLKQNSDNLIVITNTDSDGRNTEAISVPVWMFPGLAQALHLKFDHPSKGQLSSLMNRYFYSPGQARMVEEVTDRCSTCVSLKQLPSEIFSESTQVNDTFGANFSADVIRMHGQKSFPNLHLLLWWRVNHHNH